QDCRGRARADRGGRAKIPAPGALHLCPGGCRALTGAAAAGNGSDPGSSTLGPAVIRILHRTPTWIAVEKPPGMLVIPGRGEDDRACLRDEISRQLQQRVWVVHRLDRDTSGILLLALDAPTHRALSLAF